MNNPKKKFIFAPTFQNNLNMKKLTAACATFTVLLLSQGCKKSTSADFPPAHIVPLYSVMRDYNKMDSLEQRAVLSSDSVEIAAFMKTISEMPISSAQVEAWAASPAVTVFTPAVDSVFSDTAAVSHILGNILGNAQAAGLDIPRRRYASVVYGRPESILFVDSVVLIALNHYLGADYPGYSHWPVFMRAAKTPEALAPDLAEALIATRYPYEIENGTLLNRMLYEGALAHAKQAAIPGLSDAMALGYDETQYRQLLEAEKALWHTLVANRLLFDSSELLIDKFIAPSPQTNLTGTSLPGRAGRFIGKRIVDSYLKNHPETTVEKLLSPSFFASQETLRESGYGL